METGVREEGERGYQRRPPKRGEVSLKRPNIVVVIGLLWRDFEINLRIN